MKYDLLHIQGKPYVLVPLHDYRDMTGAHNDADLPADILNDLAAKPEQAVKTLRKFRDMTQKDLAEKAGISRPYLTEIEIGKKSGSVKALKGISNALNVDVSILLTE